VCCDAQRPIIAWIDRTQEISLAAHFADAIDLDTLKRHRDRIRAGLADIDRRLAAEHDEDQGPRKQIARALQLLVDCQQLYKSTDAPGKRLANQIFTNGIDIGEDEEQATPRLSEPFALTASQHTHVRHLTTSEMVESGRIELPTSCLQSRRSTN
jgi:site-specific DNA recombinase